MKIFNFFVAGLLALEERCPLEDAITLDCHPNSFSLGIDHIGIMWLVEKYSSCQGMLDYSNNLVSRVDTRNINHVQIKIFDDESKACSFFTSETHNGYDLHSTSQFDYDVPCVRMNNGVMEGNLHYFKVVNGVELAVDQPWSFSCSPSTLSISSKNYTMEQKPSESRKNHLHQQITAPNSEIIILDEETGGEAEKVKICL